jgi:hypothetical protein
MPAWRERVSVEAQADIDDSVSVALDFAKQTLQKYGELYPFAVAVSVDGRRELVGAEPGTGETPPSQDVLDLLHQAGEQYRGERRAFTVVADVVARGSDALRFEVEHREGIALVLLLPYSRARFRRTVTFGEMTGGGGIRRYW